MTEVELGVQAFWLLAGAGVLSGTASMWAFRRWSDATQLRVAVNRIVAHLFELRLFSDEPMLVLRAQGNLLKANRDFLRQMVGPSLYLLVPFAVLLAGLDAMFAHVPLQLGKPAIVTLQCSRAPGRALPVARLNAPAGMEIETEPVYVPWDSQISWRVRPMRAAKGSLELHCDGRVIGKSISSGEGIQWLSERRAGSLSQFLRHPFELPFAGTEVNSISVQYPSATVFAQGWQVWFSLAFAAGALGYTVGPTQTYLRY